MEQDNVNFRFLNKKRKLKNVSIEDIEKLFGVTRSVAYRLLSGEIKLDINRTKKLIDLLEINFDDLFSKCPIDEYECKRKNICDCFQNKKTKKD